MAKQAKKRKPAQLRTDGIDRLTNEQLREVLRTKLTLPELAALNKQVRQATEKAATEAAEMAIRETYRRHWAVTMRVLVDRFGWGQTRISRLWDACLDYLHDIDTGILTPQNILDTLEHDDGITISWEVTE